jgi:uncharacterized repeat protein (TIGR03803 family)
VSHRRNSIRKAAISLCCFLVLLASGCGGDDGGGGSGSSGSSGSGSTAPPSNLPEQTLYSFGNVPSGVLGPGALFQGSDGNFYGISSGGGSGGGGTLLFTGNGTVFKITPAGEETILYYFGSYAGDGENPASLIQGSDGNFYGTTSHGGTDGVGTVFKLTPEGVETILYSFTGGKDAEYPVGLIQGSDGNFYGTSGGGGAYSDSGDGVGGTVFKVTPEGVETILHSFGSGSDGWQPAGQLVQGSDGNLYGVTVYGGLNVCPNGQTPYWCGTVFKVTLEGVETVLHDFSGTDGEGPFELIQGSDGNFYGIALDIVFKLTPDGVESTLFSFSDTSAADPFAASWLIQGSDGNFYGTTNEGGANTGGTAFQLTPAGVLTVLHSFPAPVDHLVSEPGNLVQASDGNLYGTTFYGGRYTHGSFFELTLN